MQEIEVAMGEIAVMKGKGSLIASGVGSCLVITFYDARTKTGAMAHATLANSRELSDIEVHDWKQDAKYVDIAIGAMTKKMSALGISIKDIEAKIIGGSNMFKAFGSNVGKEIVRAARAKLKAEAITLAGESIGGSLGRSVEFDISTGIVTVRIKF